MVLGIVLRQWSIGVLGEFLLRDDRCSRGTENSGQRPLSTSASPLIHRRAFDFGGTRTSTTVLGGHSFARAVIWPSLRLLDLW